MRLDRKARKHENNVQKLDNIITENRTELSKTMNELENLHKSELEAKLMEAEFANEIWEREQDLEFDKIILEKMQLRKVQEKIALLEDLQMDRLSSLEAVEDERERRR